MKGFLLFLFVFNSVLLAENQFTDFQQKNWLADGSAKLQKADEEMKKSHFVEVIKIITEFLIVYPEHPNRLQAMTLLSDAYKKAGLYDKAIGIDLKIYMENPATEEGIKAWLGAARNYFKIGDMAKAKFILEKIKEQNFASSLSEEANLELKILKIVSPGEEQTESDKNEL